MHRHGPDCLEGPWSRAAPWWFAAASLPPSPAAGRTPASKDRVRESQPFRADLVERIRREIAEGRYDTPEKWRAAVERLLDQLSRS